MLDLPSFECSSSLGRIRGYFVNPKCIRVCNIAEFKWRAKTVILHFDANVQKLTQPEWICDVPTIKTKVYRPDMKPVRKAIQTAVQMAVRTFLCSERGQLVCNKANKIQKQRDLLELAAEHESNQRSIVELLQRNEQIVAKLLAVAGFSATTQPATHVSRINQSSNQSSACKARQDQTSRGSDKADTAESCEAECASIPTLPGQGREGQT